MDRERTMKSMNQVFLLAGVVAAGVLAGVSCNQTPAASSNTLLDEALSFNGTVSGKIATTQSTRGSTANASAAQVIPEDIDTENTCIRFHDLKGDDLKAPSGQVLPEVPLNADGTFQSDDLPVGTDFTVCVDIRKDGSCEMESCVNVPEDEDGTAGALNNVQVDPLTTMVLAKLRTLMEDAGLRPGDLPFSPATLVGRVVDAYEHLFEDSGIDGEITLDDIKDLIGGDLAALFEELVPGGAQAGMDIIKGNIGLAAADDVQSAARAAAEVFLQAGFPIADEEGGIDLSSLRSIPGIEEGTQFDLFGGGGPITDDFREADDELPPAPAFAEGEFDVTLFFNPFAEPDRNFADESGGDSFVPGLPIINDYMLLQMAELHLAGKKITLGDLHLLLTSLENGMGARMTYFVEDPNFFGPPLTIFETADGKGLAINMDELFFRLFEGGSDSLGFDELEAAESDFRALLTDQLAGTIAPSLETLAGGFMTDRLSSINDFTEKIRNATSHLPFSRSGPSDFFVVADGNQFESGETSAVTVDADIDPDGTVHSVTYNTTGSGAYFLAFTEFTAEGGIVGLLVREIGQEVHTQRGPLLLDMNENAIFGDVDGVPFIDFVSDTGEFFPGVSVVVTSDDFVPESRKVETGIVDETGLFVDETGFAVAEFVDEGPNDQMYVLSTSSGFDAEPVRVDYDFNSGIATFNPDGRHLLAFQPDSNDTGFFALFNEETGRFAGAGDPINFFDGPPELPSDFDQFYNDVDDFGSLGDVDAALLEELATLGYLDELGYLGDLGYLQDLGYLDGIGYVDDPNLDAIGTPAELDPSLTDQVLVDGFVLVSIDMIDGISIEFSDKYVFGTDVPNTAYDSSGAPFFDDINGNGVEDAGEPTAPYRPVMFDAQDWRSVDIRLFYRRTDNDGSVTYEDLDFEAQTPMTIDGVPLVARKYLARMNAFRFGRPNTAINLLTAFLPSDFFDGTNALNADTPLDVFAAVAIMNLMIDQLFNVQATVDIDGIGPLPRQAQTTDAHLFVAPVGDPFVLILGGFADLSFVSDVN